MNLLLNLFNFHVNQPGSFDSFASILTSFFQSSNPEYSPIWQSLIDVTSDIANSYGSLHSGSDSHIFDVFFKPLLQVKGKRINRCVYSTICFVFQEIDNEEHSDLYKFIERLLAKMNLGFKIATSEVSFRISLQSILSVKFQYFRKLFFDAFASNVKRKLKESYDLFRIIHVHIPEIIPPILIMHQTFLKVILQFE